MANVRISEIIEEMQKLDGKGDSSTPHISFVVICNTLEILFLGTCIRAQ